MRKTLLTFASALALAATGIILPAGAAELRFAYQADIQNLDPLTRRDGFTADMVASVMEPLVIRNPDLKLEGALAKSWEQTAPNLWVFHLRPGVTFSNGYAFVADDVVATFKLAANEKSLFRTAIANVVDIRKLDDLTVEVETLGPYPLLLNDLSNMPIFSARWLAENNVTGPVDPTKDEDSYTLHHVLGTGPFKLVEFQPGVHTVLEENPTWWNAANKKHNLTKVEFFPIAQPAARVAALLSGQVDLVFPTPLQDLARITDTSGLKVVESPELRALHIGLDMGSDELRQSNVKGANPLKDIRVRQALYQAIDIDTIVAKIMGGHAAPLSVIMAPALGGYDASLDGRAFPYDVEAAKSLLAEAGYPDGFELGFTCSNDRYVNDAAICTALAGMFAKIGVKVHLALENGVKFFPTLEHREADMYMLGWAANTTLDAHNFVQQLMVTPDGKRGGYNAGMYSNARIDELEPLIASETDPVKRQAMITEVFQIEKKEIGHIPLHVQTNVWAMRDGIEVVQPASGNFWLRYITVN